VSTAQRKALAVRDGGCVGCLMGTRQASLGFASLRRDRRRPHDLTNLVLVCWRCHRDIHHTGKHPIRGPMALDPPTMSGTRAGSPGGR
jgi:HNH endonuclease